MCSQAPINVAEPSSKYLQFHCGLLPLLSCDLTEESVYIVQNLGPCFLFLTLTKTKHMGLFLRHLLCECQLFRIIPIMCLIFLIPIIVSLIYWPCVVFSLLGYITEI